MNTPDNSAEVLVCYHCGNTTPHEKVGSHRGRQLFEQIDDRRFHEDYDYELYQCPTCRGISVFGDFAKYPLHETLSARRIYPRGSHLVPNGHKLASVDCVPVRLSKLYEEIAPLRHIAPNAFAGQIRRALEFICRDQKAEGAKLFDQIKDLVARGTFPGYFGEMTDLMRQIGNLGAHAGTDDVSVWDAELLDDFFCSVVEYVYIAPSRIERLKQRLGIGKV